MISFKRNRKSFHVLLFIGHSDLQTPSKIRIQSVEVGHYSFLRLDYNGYNTNILFFIEVCSFYSLFFFKLESVLLQDLTHIWFYFIIFLRSCTDCPSLIRKK